MKCSLNAAKCSLSGAKCSSERIHIDTDALSSIVSWVEKRYEIIIILINELMPVN
jgi:hypothetical protein